MSTSRWWWMRGAEEDETQPLLASETAKSRLCHTPSIYSAMVFQPPLTRKQCGHYWKSEMLLIWSLLILTVILQVVLTVIAGGHLLAVDYNFKQSLVGGKVTASPYVALANSATKEAEGLRQKTADAMPSKALDFIDSAKKLAGMGAKEDGSGRCCNGATCASLGFPCCDRSSARPHKKYQPMRPLEARINASEDEQDANVVEFMQPREGEKNEKPGKKKKSDKDEDLREKVSARSICIANSSNTLFCNPASYGFIDSWDDLDTDKDGKWSLDEARRDEANLGCRLGIPAEDVFRSSCRGVLRDVQDTSDHHNLNYSFIVPMSITEYEAVPKAYFDWWVGLVVLCVEFDPSRCSELVGRGIFDGALNSGKRWTSGGVKDLDSALDYCQRMLQSGGLCEQSLPGFYSTYRQRTSEKCGAATYEPGARYINPHNEWDAMQGIKVSYSTVSSYEEYSTKRFRFFLIMILLMWYVNLLDELRDIVKLIDFVCHFPVDNINPWLTDEMRTHIARAKLRIRTSLSSEAHPEFDQAEMAEADEAQDQDSDMLLVSAIAWPHWIMCVFMVVLRLTLLAYLFHVGTTFLLTDQGYADLLLNSVALAFILDLPVMLYVTLVSDRDKKALENARTTDFETGLPTKGVPRLCVSKAFWGMLILPVLIYWVVDSNFEASTIPVLEALRCSCLQEGPNCEVSHRFTREWWNNYWHHINLLFATNEGSYIKTG